MLEQLYHRYYSAAFLYCITLCKQRELAEDIAADAFVKAYLSLPGDIPSFQYWLLRVCRNLWLDHLRREKKFAPEEAMSHLADPDTPEIRYLRSEQQQVLWQAIGTLASLDRELVTLHYFSGLPLQEIASLTGLSYTAVRQRMVRLRNTLKKQMEEQGYG